MKSFLLALVAAVVAQDPPFPFPVPLWDCPVLTPPPPATNVRQLHPLNIKAVLALGDSISAGFAMKGYPGQDFLEYRDYVYSTGAASDAETLYTWLQRVGAKPNCGSQSWTWPLTPGQWGDGAVSMAKVEDVPSQIEYLVGALKGEYAGVVDFENDWKLLTLFIGANNICDACQNSSASQPAYFEQQLDAVLAQIQSSIPRVFVSLITIFNISGVWNAGQTKGEFRGPSYRPHLPDCPEYCRILWDGITDHECYCLTTGKASDRLAMDEHSVIFNGISEQLAAKYASMNNPNFTVVVQPGLSGVNITQMGEAFLSDLDCFHPNEGANKGFTLAVWNNMFQPVGQKEIFSTFDNITLVCPGPNTYLAT